jgi:cephalosporin hydroxylase
MAKRNLRHEFARHLGKLRSPSAHPGDAYHRWYYDTTVWMSTKWMGLSTYKSVSDMWNYQEILYSLQPSLIVEFGTFNSGSALFFATVMRQIGNPFKIFSVDVDSAQVAEKVRRDPDIELLTVSSTDSQVASRITALKTQYPGKIFAILDSDHTKPHVLAEMMLLRPLLNSGRVAHLFDFEICFLIFRSLTTLVGAPSFLEKPAFVFSASEERVGH